MDGSGVGGARIEGVVIGVLAELVEGRPRVLIPALGLGPLFARSLVPLDATHLGAEVAVMFEGGAPEQPLVLGRMAEAGPVVLEKDGRITIRGSYVTSHASATNRVRGGSVHLN